MMMPAITATPALTLAPTGATHARGFQAEGAPASRPMGCDAVSLDASLDGSLQAGRDLADEIKKRSTLVGLVQPAGIVVGLVSHPVANLQALGDIASLAVQGELGASTAALGRFVDRAVRPTGVGGFINSSSMALQTLSNAAVGGVEIYEGVRNKDRFLAYMGGADLLAGAAAAVQMAGAGLPAMGLALAAAATRVGLVVARHDQYSRIQKAKVLFDAAGSVSSALLRSGLAPLPALIGNAVFGPGQMLYMNSARVRAAVDRAVDWVVDHVPHRAHDASSGIEGAPLAVPVAQGASLSSTLPTPLRAACENASTPASSG